jgi:hypothetical protein
MKKNDAASDLGEYAAKRVSTGYALAGPAM